MRGLWNTGCPACAGHDSGVLQAIAFSRHRVPESCFSYHPQKNRGRRECRMQAAPMARLQQKTQAVVTTGQPNSPAFPARWFTAYTCSPRCAGLFSHRRARKSSRKRLTSASGGRDPHDFARPCRPAFVSRGPTRPSHPAPRFVTIGRNAPLDESGWARINHDFRFSAT